MHELAPRPYLQVQFGHAYDLYLRTKEVLRLRVGRETGRDALNWRLANFCPPCTYKVEGEAVLDPPILMTVDGNNSLKRAERRDRRVTDSGAVIVGPSVESLDDRQPPRDYYLSETEVNRFGKDAVAAAVTDFIADPKWLEGDDKDGCGKIWQNTKEAVVRRARGVYEATGIVAAFCRHSVCALLCDMLKSGEL
jgi:hypothetical protein